MAYLSPTYSSPTVGALDDAALLARLASDGVCTMQAAAAQQLFRGGPAAASLLPRSDEQLRHSFNHRLYAIKLSSACRMYGVVHPAEKAGFRAHRALFDAQLAGRLYFAMPHARHRVCCTAACALPCWVALCIQDAQRSHLG